MNAAQRAAHFKAIDEKKNGGRKDAQDREIAERNEMYRTGGGQVNLGDGM